MSIRLNYPEQSKAYDEMFHGIEKPREHYKDVFELLAILGISEFKQN
jgi:uncharacterized circularly permuted ATP-grasp superfamily protein